MCADVNIMPISVYILLYHDGDLKKLTPSQLQIGTYTTDTVKIIWNMQKSTWCIWTARS